MVLIYLIFTVVISAMEISDRFVDGFNIAFNSSYGEVGVFWIGLLIALGIDIIKS